MLIKYAHVLICICVGEDSRHFSAVVHVIIACAGEGCQLFIVNEIYERFIFTFLHYMLVL